MADVFQEVVACVEVTIMAASTIYPVEMRNVLHFQTPGAEPNAADVEACASIVDNWCTSVYRLNFSSSVGIYKLHAQSLYAPVAPFFDQNMSQLGSQSAADELMHAPLILLHGALSSRHEAGRVYCFPPGSDQLETGYSTIQMNNLVNAFINLRAAAASEGYQLAVASRALHQAFRAASITYSTRKTVQKRRRANFGR